MTKEDLCNISNEAVRLSNDLKKLLMFVNIVFFAYPVNSFLNIVTVYFFKGCQVKVNTATTNQ